MTTQERAHSRYGGSIASRWMNCPGSVALCDTVPEIESGSHAKIGTDMHAMAEAALRSGTRTAPNRAVQVYLDAVWAEVDADPHAELYIEERFTLDLDAAEPGEVYGSNDAMVYSPSRKRLVVFDYKNGAESVQAEGNAQLKFYAAGAAFAKGWPLAEIELVIVQPNALDVVDAGAVRRAAFAPTDLLDFVHEASEAVRRTKEHPEEFTAGPWCRWCRAATICPARHSAILTLLNINVRNLSDMTPNDLPPPRGIPPEELAKTLQAIDMFEDWAKQVRSYAFGLAISGQEVPGFKLVEKQARRKWAASDDEVAGYLSVMYGIDPTEVAPPSLVTITEIEKLLSVRILDKNELRKAKEDISIKFTVKDSSGVKLVSNREKGDPVTPGGANAFGHVSLPQDA